MCEHHHKSPVRPGKTTENESAHRADHQMWSRRDFLSATGLLGAGSMLFGGMNVRAFQPTPLLASLAAGGNDRVLVLIRLDGGNDGLNTIIERGNSYYYNLRPNIAITEQNMWGLNSAYGMPLSTQPLQSMWQDEMMKIILNVGYPEPNYSHFRSYDIVASASDSDQYVNTGWIGRFLDNEYPAYLEAPPTVPPALQIGVQANLVFKSDAANMALAVSSPEEFYQIAQTGQLYDVSALGNTPRELELAYVRQTANAAFRYAQTIKTAYSAGTNQGNYPADNDLAEQLAIVAKLIKGNLGTKIFMVEIGGFDTHANQYDYHLYLWTQISESIKAFYEDLAAGDNDLEQKVLSMTFSEFGRTIYENGSLGTDHGWGTPMLLFGGGLGTGITGNYQDLSNPDPYTDPAFSVDFRSVYSTVLQDWLGTPPEVVNFVMNQEHQTINGLVPSIAPLTGDNGKCALLGHNPHPSQANTVQIKYSMMQDGPIRLQLLDQAGHPIRTMLNEVKTRGSYVFDFKPQDWFLPPGTYQYRLQASGQVFQRGIKV
jgi:uncharacterized protein (DUF1501 family)